MKEKEENEQTIPYCCLFFGHKIGDLNDGGYTVCEKCGCHSYYDSGVLTENWFRAGIFMRPIWYIQRKLYQIKNEITYWYRRVILGDKLPF